MFVQQFNAGLFDYLIATDDNNQTKEKEEVKGDDNKDNKKNKRRFKPKLDAEFGVVRGIDFKKVHTVRFSFLYCNLFFTFLNLSLNLFFAQVINYDMPQSVTGYIHRIGRTGRAYSSGSSVSLVSFFCLNDTFLISMTSSNDLLYLLQVSPGEMEGFEEIKSFLAGEEDKDSDIITPFPLLTENAVESLRYRAEVSSNLLLSQMKKY